MNAKNGFLTKYNSLWVATQYLYFTQIPNYSYEFHSINRTVVAFDSKRKRQSLLVRV